MESQLERQPDFLEQDSPAVHGETYIFYPDAKLFSMAAHDITDSTLSKIPRSPRSPRMAGMLQTQRLKAEEDEELEKHKRLDVKTRMKFIDDARTASLSGSMAPKTKAEYHGVPDEGVAGAASLSTDAKQFLTQSTRRRKGAGRKELLAEQKLDEYRKKVETGAVSLRQLQHRSPGKPKPSHGRPAPRGRKEEEEAQALPWEEEIPIKKELPTMKVLLSCGLARLFFENLSRKFRSKVITHKYEEDDHAMHEIGRIQVRDQ